VDSKPRENLPENTANFPHFAPYRKKLSTISEFCVKEYAYVTSFCGLQTDIRRNQNFLIFSKRKLRSIMYFVGAHLYFEISFVGTYLSSAIVWERYNVSFILLDHFAIAVSDGNVLSTPQDSQSFSLDDLMKESFLWAVPKHRRSIFRRRQRRFGSEEYFWKPLRAKTNIVTCVDCGSNKEAGRLCPCCYAKASFTNGPVDLGSRFTIFTISGLLCRGLIGISSNVSVLLSGTLISGQVSHVRLNIKKARVGL